MNTIKVRSWKGFLQAVDDIRRDMGRHTRNAENGDTKFLKNDVLFRGQADSRWGLASTLERFRACDHSVVSYIQRVDSVINELETNTGRRWRLPKYPTYRRRIDNTQEEFDPHIPNLELLVYLRHHGFPSPLLDWTRSPLIAAFFAFEPQMHVKKRAVYVFVETPDGGKSYHAGGTYIHTVGKHLTADARHFSQKAQYSYAVSKSGGKWFFTSHDKVTPSHVGIQDYLVKIEIPDACRKEILSALDDCNINMYTLLGSEDALVRSLGLRAFVID